MVNAKARQKVGANVRDEAESRTRQGRAGQAIQGKPIQGRKSIGLGRAG